MPQEWWQPQYQRLYSEETNTYQPIYVQQGSQVTINQGPNLVSAQYVPPPAEKGPLDWLHEQVEETCALGRAA
jgi:hypothetical protein